MITPSSTPGQEPFTRAMIIRAAIKALCLYVVFNLVYGAVQPAANGLLPSLYNTLFPGRSRFVRGFEYDAYRLIEDHVISQAQSTTFNVVFLGSSEIWGFRTSPTGSLPSMIDGMGLVAADGRPVQIYNLGYSFPSGIKDLVLLEVLARKHIPVDLVIVSTFSTTLSASTHPITDANVTLRTDILDHYHLTALYDVLEVSVEETSVIPLWNDRNALSPWASMQMRSLMWSLTGDDIDAANAGLRISIPPSTQFPDASMVPDTYITPQHEILAAWAQFSHEHAIPLIVLEAPVPLEVSILDSWLRREAQAVGLPLLDCWNVFRTPAAFEDYHHIATETYVPYADIIARSLTDPALATEGQGLPLHLPSETLLMDDACVFLPSHE